MNLSAYRTVAWKAPKSRALLVPQLLWPPKLPLDRDDHNLDLTAFLADAGGDTIVSVTASAQLPSLQVTLVGAGFSGAVCSALLFGGIAGTSYVVDFLVTFASGTVKDFEVTLPVGTGLPMPSSPLLLAPGSTWFQVSSSRFVAVPNWQALPTAPPGGDEFWINGVALFISPSSSLLATSPVGLALGDIWSNGGQIMAAGNPGLPAAPPALGGLWFNGGAIAVAPAPGITGRNNVVILGRNGAPITAR